MKLRDIYFDSIASWISGGNLINRDAMSSLGIRTLYGRIVTKKYIRKTFYVHNLPIEYEYNLTHIMNEVVFNVSPASQAIVHTYNVPVDIPIYSDIFKRQLGHSESEYNNYKEAFDTLKSSEKMTGKKIINPDTGRRFYIRGEDLDRIRIKYQSYRYVYSHIASGGTFTDTYYFVEILSPTQKELNICRKAIMDKLRADDIYFSELTNTTSSFLRNFGIAGFMQDSNHRVKGLLMSDENVASVMPYMTHGLVGGRGLLVGVDQYNNFPLLVPFLGGTSAQVCMITGRSGEGKTYTAFQIALSALADGHHCSVVDVKGDEWKKVGTFSKHIVISLDDRTPRFINTLRLDDMDLDRESAPEFLRIAVNGTKTLIKLMVDPKDTMKDSVDLDKLLEQLITKYFAVKGVNPQNPNSFKNTSTASYAELMDSIIELSNTKSYTDNQIEILKMIRTRCAPYFSQEGVHNAMFRNEITLSEVLDCPLVIYSLNKNKDATIDNIDVLKVFMVQFLDTKKQYLRKIQGKHTLSFYEELQRNDQFITLLDFISHQVSGARSSNVSVFLLFNSLSIFEKSNTSTIASNITSYIVGKLNPRDIELLEEKFDCPEIVPMVKTISKSKEKFSNCFSILYNNGKESDKCLFKVVLPPHIEKEFMTRNAVI